MKLSCQRNIKRLLLATLAATSLTWCGVNKVAHADAEFEYPDTPSNNTITVNANNYTLNGTTINYSGLFGRSYGALYGGYSNSGNVIGNIFTFNAGNIFASYSIYGGYSKNGDVSNNTLNINGGNFSSNNISGGYAQYGDVIDNVVNIYSGSFSGTSKTNTDIYGGNAHTGNATRNTVNIQDGTLGGVYGGDVYSGDATNNVVNIIGGTVNGVVIGGRGRLASGNIINISGGTINGSFIEAGIADETSSDNFINISGGKINSTIHVGSGQIVRNNIINIWGNPDLSSATITSWGAIGVDDSGNERRSDNIFNLATEITALNVRNFDAMNFFIPKTMTNGGTMLTLTDTSGTNLSGTAIRAAMQGGSSLDTGDTVTLIQSAGTITTDSSTTYGKMSQAEYDAIKDRLPAGMLSDGVSLDYDMTIEKSGDNAIIARIGNATTDDTTTTTDSTTDTTMAGTTTPTDSATDTTTDSATDTTTNSTATVPATIINGNGSGNRSSGKLLPQTQLIANSAVYPTLQLVNFMNDKLVDWLPPSSFDFDDEAEDDVTLPDVPQKEPKGYEIFITGSGGSFRTKTGSGSYIESTLKGFDVGFGRSIDYSNGRLVFAPIFEYATGDYDSYLDDGMHGKGSTKYMAGGLIGRKTFKSGFYIEASARGGKTERDFSSDTMTSGGAPVFVHYSKTSAPIFAGHLRVGRQLRLNKNNLLDVYGIYFHTHQGSMNVNLSTGEDYHFSSANAGKVRLGYRLTTRTSRISRIYTGLAFQYEHNSDAIGMYKGRRTPGTGNHGASGMLELGWMIRPNKDNPWMLDLNATGFVGHQRGLSGTLKLQKEF